MTLPQIEQLSVIDAMITNLHQNLRELYEQRAEIVDPTATDRHHKSKRTVTARTLKSINLNLNDTPRSLILR